jgi:lysophospholipase L1-like esterase
MIECLIMGDSLAVGVGQIRKECVTYAKSGINSYDYVNRHVLHTNGADKAAKTVIISLGSNDTKNIETFDELDTLRQLVKADRVYWILPANKPDVTEIVEIIARNFGDTILPITKLSKDGVHPTTAGYKELSEKSR